MSLDDECPTQYFGPDAQVWDSPDGRSLQLSPAQGERAASHGWWLNTDKLPIVFGPEVPDVVELPGGFCVPRSQYYDGIFAHRSGCGHERTGRCICAYLAQWHATGYLAPTFRKDHE